MNITRRKINYVGKFARVRSCFGGQPLPPNLPEGALVKIIGFDIGNFNIEFQGNTFRIPMSCVENLHLLWR